jgi:hypothetical protein
MRPFHLVCVTLHVVAASIWLGASIFACAVAYVRGGFAI